MVTGTDSHSIDTSAAIADTADENICGNDWHVVGTVLGWGLVVNTAASWLNWQGYLLFFIGGKEGSWAAANLGVIVALIIGLAGSLMFQRGDIAKQEADLPVSEA